MPIGLLIPILVFIAVIVDFSDHIMSDPFHFILFKLAFFKFNFLFGLAKIHLVLLNELYVFSLMGSLFD